MTTDYGKSRYGDAVAEWAESIVNDGMADETAGTVEYGGSHYALVTLRYSTTAEALQDAADEAQTVPTLLDGSRVILRTDSQGFVDVHYGPAHPLGDPPAYRALMAEWRSILDDDGGRCVMTLYRDAQRPAVRTDGAL